MIGRVQAGLQDANLPSGAVLCIIKMRAPRGNFRNMAIVQHEHFDFKLILAHVMCETL